MTLDHCIDPARLDAIDLDAIRNADPFPWYAMEGLIDADCYTELLRELPPLERFRKVRGRRRRYGQKSHDRYALDDHPKLPLAPVWRDFIDELTQGPYRELVARLLGHDDFFFTSHWHYTPRGDSVSPHTDADWKLGSHIFYFNDEREWDLAWGGQTVILDDGGEMNYTSAPEFEDFRSSYAYDPRGNHSLLFLRTDHSWHGVEPLKCPEDRMRKVFIVEYRADTKRERFRAMTGL